MDREYSILKYGRRELMAKTLILQPLHQSAKPLAAFALHVKKFHAAAGGRHVSHHSRRADMPQPGANIHADMVADGKAMSRLEERAAQADVAYARRHRSYRARPARFNPSLGARLRAIFNARVVRVLQKNPEIAPRPFEGSIRFCERAFRCANPHRSRVVFN